VSKANLLKKRSSRGLNMPILLAGEVAISKIEAFSKTDIFAMASGKGGRMHTEDLLRVISDVDFIRDDIDDIREQLQLTHPESKQLAQAVSSLEAAKSILVDLLPNIRSLSSAVREELSEELAEI
jgi:hypothetical protein